MSEPHAKSNVKPGDWIRFYRNGELVIGAVQYVVKAASWSREPWQYRTDLGITETFEELRPAPEPRS